MGQHVKDFPSLTWTGTSTVSNAITSVDDCDGLAVFWSSSTGTTMTLQASLDPTSTSAFGTIQSGGADVSITAGETVIVSPVPFRQFRLLATGTSTGSLFKVAGTFRVQ